MLILANYLGEDVCTFCIWERHCSWNSHDMKNAISFQQQCFAILKLFCYNVFNNKFSVFSKISDIQTNLICACTSSWKEYDNGSKLHSRWCYSSLPFLSVHYCFSLPPNKEVVPSLSHILIWWNFIFILQDNMIRVENRKPIKAFEIWEFKVWRSTNLYSFWETKKYQSKSPFSQSTL